MDGGFALVMLVDEVSPTLAPPGYLWSLLRMLGALLLVCLLAYLLLRGLRRLALQRAQRGSMRVLERCPLSSRHSLWVVEVGDRCFLLGASEPGGPIARLAELDRTSLTSLENEPAAGRPRSFRDMLAKLGVRPPGES